MLSEHLEDSNILKYKITTEGLVGVKPSLSMAPINSVLDGYSFMHRSSKHQ
jgi:hypothetical protein